jgi:hypothetical protein
MAGKPAEWQVGCTAAGTVTKGNIQDTLLAFGVCVAAQLEQPLPPLSVLMPGKQHANRLLLAPTHKQTSNARVAVCWCALHTELIPLSGQAQARCRGLPQAEPSGAACLLCMQGIWSAAALATALCWMPSLPLRAAPQLPLLIHPALCGDLRNQNQAAGCSRQGSRGHAYQPLCMCPQQAVLTDVTTAGCSHSSVQRHTHSTTCIPVHTDAGALLNEVRPSTPPNLLCSPLTRTHTSFTVHSCP